MSDILTGILITGNGRYSFDGLYDEYGDPVKILIAKTKDDVILSVTADNSEVTKAERHNADCGISEEEIDRVCQAQDSCDDCPLYDHCVSERGEYDE